MPSERGRDALLGILENAEAALEFTDGIDADAFAADRMRYYAVTRCLEIISEASRRVDDETRIRHPQIPWTQIADAGNVYGIPTRTSPPTWSGASRVIEWQT